MQTLNRGILMHKMIARCLLILASAGVTGCWGTLGDSEFRGKVLHADTKEPISGAVVVARWRGHRAGLIDGRSICYHVETAVSDQDGNFVVPGWEDQGATKHASRISDKELQLLAYKQGYDYVVEPIRRRDVIFMTKFVGIPEEKVRLLYPGHLCGVEDGSFKNLLRYYLAMLEEAKIFAIQTGNIWPEVTLRDALGELGFNSDPNITEPAK
jgi:hypothetical protein